ncbi:hypothetical protein AAFF_G00359970 [Aldrovandia affinis]|uniref:Uncharacterized protein n=1 Tax=Aldrovandia affinis TaxID=143900 RepID=A0AAD7SI84_9TELE|nr:hypothetical protein AAFF_G00359970 [Aldrovandia affinis]
MEECHDSRRAAPAGCIEAASPFSVLSFIRRDGFLQTRLTREVHTEDPPPPRLASLESELSSVGPERASPAARALGSLTPRGPGDRKSKGPAGVGGAVTVAVTWERGCEPRPDTDSPPGQDSRAPHCTPGRNLEAAVCSPPSEEELCGGSIEGPGILTLIFSGPRALYAFMCQLHTETASACHPVAIFRSVSPPKRKKPFASDGGSWKRGLLRATRHSESPALLRTATRAETGLVPRERPPRLQIGGTKGESSQARPPETSTDTDSIARSLRNRAQKYPIAGEGVERARALVCCYTAALQRITSFTFESPGLRNFTFEESTSPSTVVAGHGLDYDDPVTRADGCDSRPHKPYPARLRRSSLQGTPLTPRRKQS